MSETPDNEYCNFLRRIRESFNQKGCSLTKDEAIQLKSDLLAFVHYCSHNVGVKQEDAYAIRTVTELLLTYFS